jgi:tRNA-Thr(GGU) m(6)t(6)A37 methyltransferase TsaA
MKRTLWIDTSAGISAEQFAAALVGLGARERDMMKVMESAVKEFGMVDAHTHIELLPDGALAHRLHLIPLAPQPMEGVSATLDDALSRSGVQGSYANFARRVLAILHTAEEQYSANTTYETFSLPAVGTAHTPYKQKAPYQPDPGNINDGAFYIEIAPQYAAGMQELDTFSHIFVLSYLDRSASPEITVNPPWKGDKKRYGIFATRSPNRPSPIGLTRARLLYIEGNRIITGPLDLFDSTPVLDIKPFIHSIDGAGDEQDAGNDGWLEGSDHLELHRLGIPHEHPSSTEILSHPQLLVAILTGIAWGLQYLDVDLSSIFCISPITVGFALRPLTQAVLEQHDMPCKVESELGELVTPVGAGILAALTPTIVDEHLPDDKRTGIGLGQDMAALRLFFFDLP